MNLVQYRKVEDRWQFCPVVREKGKPNPKLVLINGDPVSSRDGGVFFLDWREDGKRKRKSAGRTYREALDAWRNHVGMVNGAIDPEPEEEPTGITVDGAVKAYLRDVAAIRKDSTVRGYEHDLKWVSAHLKKHYAAKIDRSDAMALFAAGRAEGLAQSTINRRVKVMLKAMRAAGATITMRKGEWPKVEETEIEMFTDDELTKFFAACDDEERLTFQVFLATGFRDREVATLTYSDIDFANRRINVQKKPGFSPKNYEIRAVVVAQKLIDRLKARRKTAASQLVFPTEAHHSKKDHKGGKPNGKLLEMCKDIAFRANLNCGHCTGELTVYVMRAGKSYKDKRQYRCATSPHCSHWFLHKFRHTFATQMLQSRVDVRTLQKLMGHKHLSTTERYLKVLRLDDLQAHVEQSKTARFM